jgi:hypothetical protein
MKARTAAVAITVVCLCHAPRNAHADDADIRATARARFESGVKAVERGDLATAALEFRAAYALSPQPVVLYNLGLTESALGRPVETVRALRAYLASQPNDAQRVSEVTALIRMNERRVGLLALQVKPETALLEVDGVAVVPEGGKIALAAGPHVLVGKAEGHAPEILNLTVLPETEIEARIELEPLRSTAPEAASPRRPYESDATRAMTARSHRWALVSIAMGGVGATALGVGGTLALMARDLDDAARRQGHCDARTCDSLGLPLREKAGRRANQATGFLIAGGALVGGAVTLFFLTRERDRPAAFRLSLTASATRTSVGAALRVGL